MKVFRWLDLTTISLALLAGLFVHHAYAYGASDEISDLPYHYHILTQSPNPSFTVGETGFLQVVIKNMGQSNWDSNQIFLGSILFNGVKNTESQFATAYWQDNHRILPDNNSPAIIYPRDTVQFSIPLQTVKEVGTYQELFQLALNDDIWINGEPIKWLISIGDSIAYQSISGEKRIVINLANQRLWAVNEDNIIILNALVSTGKSGYGTPKGSYTIHNHIDTAYSSSYKLYMDNWMELDSSKFGLKGYGIHALPHVRVNPNSPKFKGKDGQFVGGRLLVGDKYYEGFSHLGKKISHGCVRLGLNTSKALFNWAENGTAVQVV